MPIHRHDIVAKAIDILDRNPTAVLTTVDADGRPRSRWMHPVILSEKDTAIYALTSASFGKVTQSQKYPRVEWMMQTDGYYEVLNLRGDAEILDIPDLKRQVLERLGKRLTRFWKLTKNETELVVMCTRITEATLYRPQAGTKETVVFST